MNESAYYDVILTVIDFLVPSNLISVCIYTGWPRKNATTSIINFKDIVNKTDLFFFILLGRKLIFQQNDTMTIKFG